MKILPIATTGSCALAVCLFVAARRHILEKL
jgi:hypothetical protein